MGEAITNIIKKTITAPSMLASTKKVTGGRAAGVTFSPAQAGVAANSLIHSVLHIILCAKSAEDFA